MRVSQDVEFSTIDFALLRWIAVVGVFAAFLMGVDKLLSKLGARRISERSFVFVALIGGFLGVIAGAMVFHHKTAKASFWPGIVAATIVWVVGLYALAG